MAAIRSPSLLLTLGSSSSSCQQRGITKATMNAPNIWISPLSLPKISDGGLVEELSLRTDCRVATIATTRKEKDANSWMKTSKTFITNNGSDATVIAKLYEIMEAVADRVEVHKNIGEQRNNWNHLLLTSINAMTLTAATMCGVAAISVAHAAPPLVALKASSTLLYLAATGLVAIMNKIQPSQLTEEQRNAARLFKQLHGQIHTMVSIGNPTITDVNEKIQKVLALDKAYPLPLLGAMLEKFPSNVEPAVWWPNLLSSNSGKGLGRKADANGWNRELEEEMRQIVVVLERKDKDDYLRLGKIAVAVNKVLAISGPILTSLAALGTIFVGTNPWAAVVGVAAGALGSIVNAMEHGGQVGMVFEMYRSNAGFFQMMKETIESNVKERRENGEVFEMKVALQLGRSLSELKNLAASSATNGAEDAEEFACKLF